MSDYEDRHGAAELPFELVEPSSQTAVLKVIGVGGGGGNAVERMVADQLAGVEFIAANTDAQALLNLKAPNTMQLGQAATKGLGAGADPEVGRLAAMEDREEIQRALDGADMVFITAGMGGGTGTGAAPVVAQIAKGLDILTVAVVTKPFEFENRTRVAEDGIAELAEHVDSVIAIPNEKLLDLLGDDASLDDCFNAADDVLRGAVQGIADVIIRPGRINVDFADVRTVMSERGLAIMGTGEASGSDRARQAVDKAIHNPLLDDVDLRGARGVVVNVTATSDLGIREFQTIGKMIREFTAKDSTVVMGTVADPNMGDAMRVTVVATGLGGAKPTLAVNNPGGWARSGAREGLDAAGPAPRRTGRLRRPKRAAGAAAARRRRRRHRLGDPRHSVVSAPPGGLSVLVRGPRPASGTGDLGALAATLAGRGCRCRGRNLRCREKRCDTKCYRPRPTALLGSRLVPPGASAGSGDGSRNQRRCAARIFGGADSERRRGAHRRRDDLPAHAGAGSGGRRHRPALRPGSASDAASGSAEHRHRLSPRGPRSALPGQGLRRERGGHGPCHDPRRRRGARGHRRAPDGGLRRLRPSTTPESI